MMKRISSKKKHNTKKPRVRIPSSVKQQVLTEAGYMCANPRCKHILTLELHHIEWVRDEGGNDPSNLLALCSNCHDSHTRGHIKRNAIDTWKQMLMVVNSSLDRESLDLLLFMYQFEQKSLDHERCHNDWRRKKDEEYDQLKANEETMQKQFREHEEKWSKTEPPTRDQPLRVTGDGLLRLVRLIRTGLVAEGHQRWEQSDWLNMYYWEPKLTSIGRLLAEAFVNGEAKTFRELLSGQHDTSTALTS